MYTFIIGTFASGQAYDGRYYQDTAVQIGSFATGQSRGPAGRIVYK